ncbi:MAG: polysaccharide biosynthesis protein [Bacteroidales bacterium]|nr:polysaccharide biosynthesis protein [Bacteroidales bacterium]
MIIDRYPKLKDLVRRRVLKLFLRYNLPRWVVFVADNTLIFLLFLFSYLVRLNFASEEINILLSVVQGLIVTGVYVVFSLVFKSYAAILRHTTLTDVALLFVDTTTSLAVTVGISFIGRFFEWSGYLMIPLSVILIHYVFVTVILFFIRLFVKIVFRFATMNKRTTKKVLIYGAGEMGFIVKRVILSDPIAGFAVTGFIDDNRRLQGFKINGIPVYGPEIFTNNFLLKNRINTLIIAISNISRGRKSEIIRRAMDSGLEVLETPSIDNWLHGRLEVGQLRKVRLEDLLGRDPIRLNLELISLGLNNKTILVTGAAGSIGSEIVRQLARFNTKNVILVDQAETPMFHIKNELESRYLNLNFNLLLADVTNYEKMELIFKEFRPEIVFHAAAYKHVPLMEDHPHEAFRVNVGGTKTITDLSVKYGVSKFVMVSSDKSVNPANVMGATKRLCEIIVQSKAQEAGVKTQFVITRFGNVLGSNGSVIPLFQKQIREGGPVTVTHPEITRYFMTIPEACELVLEAGFMGKDDEIYVFDMGKPVPIVDLAYQMIRLSGLVPERDIEVIFTGLRPGEKLFEELLTDRENTLPTHHPKIKIAKVEKVKESAHLKVIDEVLIKLYTMSKQDVVNAIKKIVPEYLCSNGKYNGSFKTRAIHKSEPGEDSQTINPVSKGGVSLPGRSITAKASGDNTQPDMEV